MGQPLSYHEFRSLHKGTPRTELSELWSKYKEGTYSFPVEDTSPEEVIEEPKSSAEDAETVSDEETVGKVTESPWDVLIRISREFEYLNGRLTTYAFLHSKAEIATKRTSRICLHCNRLVEAMARTNTIRTTCQYYKTTRLRYQQRMVENPLSEYSICRQRTA